MTIKEILEKYRGKLDLLDTEILIAHSLKKSREFLLTYPEHEITNRELSIINKLLRRRLSSESVAHIVGHKEFYGLDFIVNKHTLIPRPETELMVEKALSSVISHQSSEKITLIDIGTGSGCIIISLAHELERNARYKTDTSYYATDISSEALKIAKKNAKVHELNKKIKFIKSDLLSAFIQDTKYNIQNTNLIITANLPYLSKEIYDSTPIDVKKFEPKSALYSDEAGLAHYRKLLQQVEKSFINPQVSVIMLLEISPEQKTGIKKLALSIFPSAKIETIRDLTGRWRLCKISI